ncbi:hypothetical protein EDC01DRAFT_761372 [Geopyxis carbonaria]|nr:hypothetical protein EDC01DRAFT_761372 [Geopyxis carbonaria]
MAGTPWNEAELAALELEARERRRRRHRQDDMYPPQDPRCQYLQLPERDVDDNGDDGADEQTIEGAQERLDRLRDVEWDQSAAARARASFALEQRREPVKALIETYERRKAGIGWEEELIPEVEIIPADGRGPMGHAPVEVGQYTSSQNDEYDPGVPERLDTLGFHGVGSSGERGQEEEVMPLGGLRRARMWNGKRPGMRKRLPDDEIGFKKNEDTTP